MKAKSDKKTQRFFLGLSFVMATVFVAVGYFVFIPNVSRADTTTNSLSQAQEDALKKAQNEKQDILDALKDKIKTYQKIATLKDKEHDQLSAQAENLAAQTDALQEDITGNERRLADLGQQIESLESRVDEKEKAISLQKSLLADILRSYYDSQEHVTSVPSLLLSSSEDFDSSMLGRDHLFEAGAGVRETLSGIMNLRNALMSEHDLASKKKTEIASVKFQLEQQNAYLENSRRNKEALAAQAAADQAKYSNIVSDLEKQRKAIEDEIEQLDAARAGKIDLSSIPNFSSGVLGYPVKNPRISQGYGKTTFTKWYTFHNGVDFADAVGTPILAAEDGEVVGMGDEGKYAYGKWVAIKHGNGLTTLYGHMSKQLVRNGENVDRGEKIGLMGATGYATGPHVHFGVYTSESFEIVKSSSIKGLLIPTGAHINPAKYL